MAIPMKTVILDISDLHGRAGDGTRRGRDNVIRW
jgi:hypothetical protein